MAEKVVGLGKKCFHLICIHLESYPMIIRLFSPCKLRLLSFPVNLISVNVYTCLFALYCEETPITLLQIFWEDGSSAEVSHNILNILKKPIISFESSYQMKRLFKDQNHHEQVVHARKNRGGRAAVALTSVIVTFGQGECGF